MPKNPTQPHFEDLADQFASEIRAGEKPQIEHYASQHPELADKILQLFPILEMMEREGMPLSDISEASLNELERNICPSNSTKKLGDYRILQEVGRGGMGIVFEAHQESLDRRVALKLLSNSQQFDSRRHQRFQAEARAAAMLHHTNIVPIFGVGSHEGTAYLVMQFIDGQPLNQIIDELSRNRTSKELSKNDSTEPGFRNDVTQQDTSIGTGAGEPRPSAAISNQGNSQSTAGNLSDTSEFPDRRLYWKKLAKIGIQIANALQHAHSRKILHRDIKPSNLLLEESGFAWITDFGLAKYFESPNLTLTGEMIGTLRYMSPEQVNGISDERSDIFGLGLTLYELAALTPAYGAPDRTRLLKQVIEANPKSLRHLDRMIPKDLETIIHKCIAPAPDQRYQQAQELAAELQRFVDGEPVTARRISLLERCGKWCRRRPAVTSLLAALALSLILGIAGITWQWQKTADALSQSKYNLQEATEQTAIAEMQKEIAQKHFRQARESVDHFFVIVSHNDLLRQPSLIGLRRKLLQEALQYHQQFVAQYRNNDELKMELGQSLFDIARIEGAIASNRDIAAKLDEPQRIFEEIANADPSDPRPKFWRVRCMTMKSDMLRRFDNKASFELILEARKELETLLEEFPDSIIGLNELANVFQSLGLTYESIDRGSRRTDRAMNCYQKAFLLRKRFSVLAPDDDDNLVTLAELHRDLGITHRKQGNYDKALDHYSQSMALLRKIIVQSPSKYIARKTLASVANTTGFFYANEGSAYDEQKALEYFTIAKDQYQELVDISPQVIEFQNGLARAALNRGGIYQVQDQLENALEDRMFAERIRRKLCSSNPTSHNLRSGWAATLHGVGSTLRKMKRFDEAIEKHTLAHQEHVKAFRSSQRQTVLQMSLINGIALTAQTLCEGERLHESYEKLMTIWDFTRQNQSQPLTLLAAQMTMLACDVSDRSTDEGAKLAELKPLEAKCIAQSKKAITEAAKRGHDVVKWFNHDMGLADYSDHPNYKILSDWIDKNFSK